MLYKYYGDRISIFYNMIKNERFIKIANIVIIVGEEKEKEKKSHFQTTDKIPEMLFRFWFSE